MSYKSLQTALKELRTQGIEINCKLNATKEVLQAEYDRLTTIAIESVITESVARIKPSAATPLTMLVPLLLILVGGMLATMAIAIRLAIAFKPILNMVAILMEKARQEIAFNWQLARCVLGENILT